MEPTRATMPLVCVCLIAASAHAAAFDFTPTGVDPAMLAFLQQASEPHARHEGARELAPYLLGASDFHGETIAAAGVGLDWFVADGLSVGVFGEAMHVNQRGDNAVGGGGGVLLRWFFAQSESIAMFLETGVGYEIFDHPVPEEGVSGDFTPRAAVGARIAIDTSTSLSLRAGWLHLSNAQTGENNPGIDTLAIGLGLHIEF